MNAMMRILQQETVFWFSLALASGYLLSAYGHVWVIVASFVIMIAIIRLIPAYKRLRIIGCLWVGIFSIIYFQVYDHWHQSNLLAITEKNEKDVTTSVRIRGTIHSPVKQDGDTVTFYLLISKIDDKQIGNWPRDQERIAAKIKLTQEEQITQVHRWGRGDDVTGVMKLSLPQPSRSPGGFDYKRYLRWQGVYILGTATFAEIQVRSEEGTIRRWFDHLQEAEASRVEQIYSDAPTAGYMKSLLLGVTDDVDPSLTTLYSRQGLLHVLAISGLHVTLVSACWMWLLKRVGLGKTGAVLSSLGFLVVYVLAVGASPSAVRSGIMGGLGILATSYRKQFSVRSVWGFAFTVMLLLDPYLLWQVGFQLSFAVTLGLLLYVPMLAQVRGNLPKWLYSSVSVTFVAQLISFPLLLYWFHQFSLLSWVINLVYVPIISFVILPIGYVSLLASHIHPALSYLASRLNTVILGYLHDLLMWIDAWKIPFQHWPHPSWGWLLCYSGFCALVPIFWYLGYHRRRDLLVSVIFHIVLVIAARQPFTGAHEVRITFLDVGQGDSIIVEVGREKVYLIDSGGTIQPTMAEWRKKKDPYEVGKDTLLPFLRSRGIERIDTLVMTHPDHDHVGGFMAVIPYMQVGSVLINSDKPKEAEAEALAYLNEQHVPVYTSEQITSWRDSSEVKWTWLSPCKSQTSPSLQGNDASVVLLLEAYGKQILLTGDLEVMGEQQILQAYQLPQVDILKVGHHGSKTSTSQALLDSCRPKTAVISVGENNRYHHPHLDVLSRLADSGTKVYRTDQQGTVMAIVSSMGIKYFPYLSDKK